MQLAFPRGHVLAKQGRRLVYVRFLSLKLSLLVTSQTFNFFFCRTINLISVNFKTCHRAKFNFHQIQVHSLFQLEIKLVATRNVSETYMPLWRKIHVYLLCRSKTCPKQVSKGLKYIKWTTPKKWFDLDLDLWTCALKIIGIIYLLKATPAPSLVLIK